MRLATRVFYPSRNAEEYLASEMVSNGSHSGGRHQVDISDSKRRSCLLDAVEIPRVQTAIIPEHLNTPSYKNRFSCGSGIIAQVYWLQQWNNGATMVQ